MGICIDYRHCFTRQQLLETAPVQVVEYPKVFHQPPLATGCLTRWMSIRADRSEAVFRGLPVFKELSTSQAVEVYHHLVGSHMVKQPSMVDQPVSHHAGMTRTDESCVLSAFPPVWCNIWRGKKYPGRKKPFPISLNNRSGVLGELFQQVRTGGNSHLGLNFVTFRNLWITTQGFCQCHCHWFINSGRNSRCIGRGQRHG